MKITNQSALHIYDTGDGSTKTDKIAAATRTFLETYSLGDDQFHAIRLKFNRLLSNKPKNNRNDAIAKYNAQFFMNLVYLVVVHRND